MAAETQILIGLGIGIACLIFMIMKTKIHTFLALILATVLVGVIGGIEFKQIVASITKGFGGTLGSIGIIIGFGVMMGQRGFRRRKAHGSMLPQALRQGARGDRHGSDGLPRFHSDFL